MGIHLLSIVFGRLMRHTLSLRTVFLLVLPSLLRMVVKKEVTKIKDGIREDGIRAEAKDSKKEVSVRQILCLRMCVMACAETSCLNSATAERRANLNMTTPPRLNSSSSGLWTQEMEVSLAWRDWEARELKLKVMTCSVQSGPDWSNQ